MINWKTKEKWLKKSININSIDSYLLEIKYAWYIWTEVIKDIRFPTLEEADSDMERIRKNIKEAWWMYFNYPSSSTIKKVFVFASQFKTMSIKSIAPSERIVNIKKFLT